MRIRVFLCLGILAPGFALLAACGQKGALYLPDDYELPAYQQKITRSFDAVESIVEQAIQGIVPDRDASADNDSDGSTQPQDVVQ